MSSGEHRHLRHVIRDHVIGAVARLHGSADRRLEVFPNEAADTVHIEELLAAILETDSGDFERIVARLAETDAELSAICDMLIYPATDALGQMWVSDHQSFMSVSLASSRLQTLINRLSEHRSRAWDDKQRNVILLGRMPDSSHTLGLAVISACFRERGWEVNGGPDFEFRIEQVPSLLRQKHNVLGISVGTENDGKSVEELIKRVKSYQSNRNVIIGIGGPGARNREAVYRAAGADFVANTARDAVFMAESQINRLGGAQA